LIAGWQDCCPILDGARAALRKGMHPSHRRPGLWLATTLAATGCFPRGRADADSLGVLAHEVGVPDPRPACGAPAGCSLPDCNAPENPAERLWCAEVIPDSLIELPRIRAALARMAARGGICGPLAGTIASYLARGAVHLYDSADYPAAGAVAPVDGGRSYLLLSRDFVMTFFDAAHRSANLDSRGVPRPETLQLVLAHEADHLRGLGHVDPEGFLTPNALRCSDLRREMSTD
jgi:hypothetical protein